MKQENGYSKPDRLTSRGRKGTPFNGIHDPLVDYLADLLSQNDVELHSTHVGSMGGILALKKNECHAAPMHLLAENGDYNIPYLKKYLPIEDLVLLCVTERQQGIISKNGIGFDEIPSHRFIRTASGVPGHGCCSTMSSDCGGSVLP